MIPMLRKSRISDMMLLKQALEDLSIKIYNQFSDL